MSTLTAEQDQFLQTIRGLFVEPVRAATLTKEQADFLQLIRDMIVVPDRRPKARTRPAKRPRKTATRGKKGTPRR